MAVLRAYFDASWAGGSPVTAIGGYIGSDETWEAVESEWNEGLKEWGLEDFHLAELPRQIGHEKAGLCAAYFARIISRSKLWGIATGVLDSDFDVFYGRNSKAAPISKYHLAFEMAVELVCEYVISFSAGNKVALFFDDDFKPRDAANAIFEFYQKARKSNNALHTLSIGTRRDWLGLQCADLCAGVWRENTFTEQFPQALPDIVRDISALAKQTMSAYWTLENLNSRGILALRRMAAGIPYQSPQ
jgi:hypothetical protein